MNSESSMGEPQNTNGTLVPFVSFDLRNLRLLFMYKSKTHQVSSLIFSTIFDEDMN